MNTYDEIKRNERRGEILWNIASYEAQIISLEDSINRHGKVALQACENWKQKVCTIGAITDQLREQYNELLKPIL